MVKGVQKEILFLNESLELLTKYIFKLLLPSEKTS